MALKAGERDSVAEALANAPVGEPMTEAERVAVEEARVSFARGDRTYSGEEVSAVIEQWRALGRPPTQAEIHAMLDERARSRTAG